MSEGTRTGISGTTQRPQGHCGLKMVISEGSAVFSYPHKRGKPLSSLSHGVRGMYEGSAGISSSTQMVTMVMTGYIY